MKRRFVHSRRLALGASLFISGLLAATVSSGSAHAQWGVCYNDPTLYLDNGTVMVLGTTVQADASVIKAINYSVHLPAGVTVTNIAYFGPSKSLEHVVWTADNSVNRYDSDTQVLTDGGTYNATSGMLVVGNSFNLDVANGLTGHDLLNHLISQ